VNAPQTAQGQLAWAALRRLGGQVRVSFTGVTGLDFASAIAFAEGIGAANDLFFEMLPEVEACIVRSARTDDA
jgi:hypothetical protein